MKRILAAAVLMAFMPTANAQDKGKGEVSHNAEYRVRDTFSQNPTGDDTAKPNSTNGIESRFKLGVDFKANEKLSANLTLLHSATFGQMPAESVGTTNMSAGGAAEENFMSVNQAYVNWGVSDDVSLRIGRQNYGFGNGSVMSVNDWEATPFSFEGVSTSYDLEAGTIKAFAFKHKELGLNGTDPNTATGSAAGDQEQNAYGLTFDLKNKPEWLTGLNVHLIKDIQDFTSTAGPTATTGGVDDDVMGKDYMRYGLTADFNFGVVDLSATYNTQTGEMRNYDATADAMLKTDVKANMMEVIVGTNALESFYGSRLALGYHQDTGTSAAATDAETYDGYFYDMHSAAGLMDILGWGNLTHTSLTYSAKPSDKCTVGVAYHMFTQTEKDGAIMAQSNGAFLAGAGDATKDYLGTEIDIWATHTFESGLEGMINVGQFDAGDEFGTGADAILQVVFTGKATF